MGGAPFDEMEARAVTPGPFSCACVGASQRRRVAEIGVPIRENPCPAEHPACIGVASVCGGAHGTRLDRRQ